jgi:hypothetical protein
MLISKSSLFRLATAFAIIGLLALNGLAAPPDGKGKGGGGDGGGEDPPTQPFKYAIDLIDVPPGWDSVGGQSINENRQIVGSGSITLEDGSSLTRPFLYDPMLGSAAIDLNTIATGVPEGWSIRQAIQINSSGHIAGWIQQDGADELTIAPIVINELGVVDELPDPGGDNFAASTGINDLGDVVVTYRRQDGTFGAYVYNPWELKGPIDLGLNDTFIGPNFKINNLLQVFGENGEAQIFRATIDPTYSEFSLEIIDTVTDQTTGETATILSLNEATPWGLFCGSAEVLVPVNKKRFVTERRAFVYDGEFRTLPQLGDRATTMNDSGDVAYGGDILDEGLVLPSGADQALRIVDLLDPEDPNTSAVDRAEV